MIRRVTLGGAVLREQSNDRRRPRGRCLTVAAVSAPALAVIGGAAVAHYTGAVPVSFLARDPSQIVEFPFYYGGSGTQPRPVSAK